MTGLDRAARETQGSREVRAASQAHTQVGFVHAGGIHVAGTAIWCDAARARGVTFLSRADIALGRARPERVITTARTAALRGERGRPLDEPLLPRFGRPFALGRARLELLPAGGTPGAAQLLVELDGWRGLYAGAVAPGPGRSGIEAQVRGCDELVLEAPRASARVDLEPLVRFARECGATRVHVSLRGRAGEARLALARALLARLGALGIEATPLGAPEQLSLFPR